MSAFSATDFRQQFPILNQSINDKPLVYFDNAASTQKPKAVIDSHQHYYHTCNANVHRASHALSAKATSAYESSRELVKRFINAKSHKEIIWTKGTTESINLVAQSWGRSNLKPGDEIVLSYAEHHANIVPWQIVAEQTGAKIKVLALTEQGRVDISKLADVIGTKTRIVCCSHISNVLGRVNPVSDVIKYAKKFQALTLIDGAQAIAHLPVDVQMLDCDFYVFSAHKMYGPTGVGVLYGKAQTLLDMSPYQAGGEMIKQVSFTKTTFNDLPHKFEAGTPNIAGVIAFGAAIEFIENCQLRQLACYEQELLQYCYQHLSQIPGLSFIVDGQPDIPVFSFTLLGHHNHDVATALDSLGIAVRSGHHCAMPLMQYLNINGCIRLSLAAYNSYEEIDKVVHALVSISQQRASVAPALAELAIANKMQAPKPDRKEKQSALHIDDILLLFQQAKGWDSKHRQIMLLGKNQTRLPENMKNEQSLISGCESKAWLNHQKATNGAFQFQGDSDAKVIRGLIAIVLAAVNDKNGAQILAFDMQNYFTKLGLLQHLSPSRGNGLNAIVKKIHSIVSDN